MRRLRMRARRWPSPRWPSACSLVGGDDDERTTAAREAGRAGHPRVVRAARGAAASSSRRSSGYDLVIRAVRRRRRADQQAGAHQGQPDRRRRSFGIDNTFASRAIDEGVFAPYAAELPEGAEQYLPRRRRRPAAHAGRHRQRLRQRRRHLVRRPAASRRPTTLEDLAEPAYQDLFVTPGATTSSPGPGVPARHDRRRTATTAGRTTGPT